MTLHFWGADASVARYDLVTHSWLEPVQLERIPDVVFAADGGYYIALGTEVGWVENDGTFRTVWSSPTQVYGLFATAEFLGVVRDRRRDKMNNFTDTVVTLYRSHYSIAEEAEVSRMSRGYHFFSPVNDTFFAWTTDRISSVQLQRITLDAFGEVSSRKSGRDYMFNWHPQRVWADPSEAWLIDEFGGVHDSASLEFERGLGFSLQALAFFEDGRMVALSGSTLNLVDSSFVPRGQLALAFEPAAIALDGEEVLVFEAAASGQWQTHRVRLADFRPRPEPSEIDPSMSPLAIDESFVCRLGIFYFLSREHGRVFTWHPARRMWGRSLAVPGGITRVAYDTSEHALYAISKAPNMIFRIDLSSEGAEAVAIGGLAGTGGALAVGRDRLMLFADSRFYFMDKFSGRVLWLNSHYSGGRVLTWDERSQRLYALSGGTNPDYIECYVLGEEDSLTPATIGPNRGESMMRNPLRLSPDGRFMALTTGGIRETTNFEEILRLPNPFLDAAWSADGKYLYTIYMESTYWAYPLPSSTRLQLWELATGELQREVTLPWSPVTLFRSGNRLIVVTRVDDLLRFIEISPDLQVRAASGLGESEANPVSWRATPGDLLELHWDPNAIGIDETLLVERADFESGEWVLIGEAPASAGHWAPSSIDFSTPADFRLRTAERIAPGDPGFRTVSSSSHLWITFPYESRRQHQVRYRLSGEPWVAAQIQHHNRSWSLGLDALDDPEIEVYRVVVETEPVPPVNVFVNVFAFSLVWSPSFLDTNEQFLQKRNESGEWEDIRSYDSGVEVDEIPPIDPLIDNLADYRVIIRRADGSIGQRFLQFPLIGDLSWSFSGEGVSGFEVELISTFKNDPSYFIYPIEGYTRTIPVSFSDFRRVQEIVVHALSNARFELQDEDTEMVVRSHVKWMTTVGGPNPPVGILARVEAEGEWTLVHETVSSWGRTGVSLSTPGSVAPEFAIARMMTLAPRTVGYFSILPEGEFWSVGDPGWYVSLSLGRTLNLSGGWAFSELLGFVNIGAPEPYVYLPGSGWAHISFVYDDTLYLYLFNEARWYSINVSEPFLLEAVRED